MKFDELYKFIGYSLVCLIGFYVVARSIRFQLGIVEGLVGIKKSKDVSGTDISGTDISGNVQQTDEE
jgi:hypothetical protein